MSAATSIISTTKFFRFIFSARILEGKTQILHSNSARKMTSISGSLPFYDSTTSLIHIFICANLAIINSAALAHAGPIPARSQYLNNNYGNAVAIDEPLSRDVKSMQYAFGKPTASSLFRQLQYQEQPQKFIIPSSMIDVYNNVRDGTTNLLPNYIYDLQLKNNFQSTQKRSVTGDLGPFPLVNPAQVTFIQRYIHQKSIKLFLIARW